jgi:putative hemolysin
LNGFFSGSEIAVVLTRRTKVHELEKSGKRNARVLRELKSDPDRFLATVQIGITVVGALASAVGGAAAIQSVRPLIERIPVHFISSSGEAISIGLVVIIVSYFSLVIGELVPKSIALRHPEKFSLIASRPIYRFSRITSFFVGFLTHSTNLILKLIRVKPMPHSGMVTEEEIKMILREGRMKGFFEPEEERIIRSVFEFTDLSVREIMVPITKVIAFSLDASMQEILAKMAEEQFSRYPVFHRDRSNIKGVLYVKDLFKKLSAGEPLEIRKLLRTPFFVPESMKISMLLREMQRKGVHISVVVDEYGAVTGIATIEDILEEIVGEIRDEYDVEQPVIHLKDGSYLIDASTAIRDLKEDHDIPLPESPDYDTLGGFIITRLQRIPASGEKVRINEWEIDIVHIVGRRISRVIIKKVPETENTHSTALRKEPADKA